MERSQDRWKKYPILVIGSSPVPLSGMREISLLSLSQESSLLWQDHFLFLCVAPEELPPTLQKVIELGAQPDQILYLWGSESLPSWHLDPHLGVIEHLASDSADDLRHRLFHKIETQRQKKLVATLERSHPVLRSGSSTIELLSADLLRLTHALACAHDFGPKRHLQSLESALTLAGMQSQRESLLAPWPADLPLESVLAECALLAIVLKNHPQEFRTKLRELSSALPFRVRNELKDKVEKCFSLLWEASSHAA